MKRMICLSVGGGSRRLRLGWASVIVMKQDVAMTAFLCVSLSVIL